MGQFAAANTILQIVVEEDKRGRVMSLYLMAFMGMAPLGSLAGGALAAHITVAHTLSLGGLTCMLACLLFTPWIAPLTQALTPAQPENPA